MTEQWDAIYKVVVGFMQSGKLSSIICIIPARTSLASLDCIYSCHGWLRLYWTSLMICSLSLPVTIHKICNSRFRIKGAWIDLALIGLAHSWSNLWCTQLWMVWKISRVSHFTENLIIQVRHLINTGKANIIFTKYDKRQKTDAGNAQNRLSLFVLITLSHYFQYTKVP